MIVRLLYGFFCFAKNNNTKQSNNKANEKSFLYTLLFKYPDRFRFNLTNID